MMRTCFLLLLSTVLPAVAYGQTTCPPDAPASRAWVTGYLTGQNFAAHRDSLGLSERGPADVRVLDDLADLPTCQRFVAAFGAFGSHPNWSWTAYKVGGYYFIAWRYTNTGETLRFGFIPMIILNGNFEQVGGFAT